VQRRDKAESGNSFKNFAMTASIIEDQIRRVLFYLLQK
jgi:hypothetical protein